MRIAYADPPYPGPRERQSCREYGAKPVNHGRLIAALVRFDGWALSTSSTAIALIAPMVPPGTRCAAWVKPNGVLGNGKGPTFSWEPVFFKPCRERAKATGKVSNGDRQGDPIVRDSIVTHAMRHVWRGAKPPEFCGWLFDILGCEPDDEFHDLFYGSGAVTRAWKQWRECALRGGPLFVGTGEERRARDRDVNN